MKIFKFLLVFMLALTIFNACQKNELNHQLVDEQPKEVVKPDVYAENGYLVFKDYATYDSIADLLNSNSLEFIAEFEDKMGFKSAFTYKNEVMEEAGKLSDIEIIAYLNELREKGYFDSNKKEFTYPFYNESRAVVLNSNGRVKIGETFYRFEGVYEIVTPDSSVKNFSDDSSQYPKKINLLEIGSRLKSATILFDNTTSGGQQRLTMRVYRENEAIYGYIYVPGVGDVYGILGYHWTVDLRFHSWRQRSLWKEDKNTYFHWITRHCVIGGNDDYWYLNYNPAYPYTQTSPWKAIYYYELYDSGVDPGMNPPTIHNIDVDCWSDRLPSPINYVDYQD